MPNLCLVSSPQLDPFLKHFPRRSPRERRLRLRRLPVGPVPLPWPLQPPGAGLFGTGRFPPLSRPPSWQGRLPLRYRCLPRPLPFRHLPRSPGQLCLLLRVKPIPPKPQYAPGSPEAFHSPRQASLRLQIQGLQHHRRSPVRLLAHHRPLPPCQPQ